MNTATQHAAKESAAPRGRERGRVGRDRRRSGFRQGVNSSRTNIVCDDSATICAERLTRPAASACLHCGMGMTKADLPELGARARLLVPVLRERAAETEKLRRLPDATEADLLEAGCSGYSARRAMAASRPRSAVSIELAARSAAAAARPPGSSTISSRIIGWSATGRQRRRTRSGRPNRARSSARASSSRPDAPRSRAVIGLAAVALLERHRCVALGDAPAPRPAARHRAEPRFFIVPHADYRASSIPGMPWGSPAPAARTSRSTTSSCRRIARCRATAGRAASRQHGQSRAALSAALVSAVLVRHRRHLARHRARRGA